MSFQFSVNALRYEDIRQQVVDFLKTNSAYSGTFDWSAANISYIIDTISYVTMLMSYNITNVSNNNFLDSTNIRKNAISIAKTMGYRPKRVRSAVITGTIRYYDINQTFGTNSVIKIKPKSKFISNTGSIYINESEIKLIYTGSDPNTLEASFTLKEGDLKTFTLLGTGQPYQSFLLPSLNVEENSLELYVKQTQNLDNTKVKWTEVKNSFNIVSSNIFFVEEDITKEGLTKISFGDGIIGTPPSNNETIIVNYLDSKGSKANFEYLTSIPISLDSYSIENVDNFSTSNFKDYNEKTNTSYGGLDLETIDDIKNNAPKYFSTAGRAVTKNDYINILSNYSYVYKSNVIGGEQLYNNDSTKLGNIYISAIPYIDYNNFTSNQSIYIDSSQESNINYELSQYNIISTKLNFFKPSYIYVEVTPKLEYKSNISVSDEINASETVLYNLTEYINNNFNDFESKFRLSKFTSEIDRIDEVVSSSISTKYYFTINSNSLYDLNKNEGNFIYLPINIESYDNYGNIDVYSSFIKTNEEQKQELNVSSLDINQRTIYGQIYHPNVERYMYNEDIIADNDNVYTSDIKIFGENKFFDFYRFNEAPSEQDIFNIKSFVLSNGSSINLDIVLSTYVTGGYLFDDFTLSYDSIEIGTIKRNYNQDYYKGFISKEEDFESIPTNGTFQEVLYTFNVSGDDKDFNSVEENDYVIYNSTTNKWQKAILKNSISAVTDEGLYTNYQDNDIVSISASGDFNGTFSTVNISDYLIFNSNSKINPLIKWETTTQSYLSGLDPSLNATLSLPKQIEYYDIKLIQGLDIGTTNFNERLTFEVYDDDLIFYNESSSADNKWELLINISSSAVDLLDTISAATENDILSYTTSATPIGTIYKINTIGNFGTSKDMIVWPTANTEDQYAYVDDLIVYIGNYTWKLFSRSLSILFTIDGTIDSELPERLYYGNFYSVSGSGTFNGYFNETVTDANEIMYLDNNEWKIITTVAEFDASLDFPTVAELGDILFINENGNFNNSELIYPLNSNFIDGDYIIFVGPYWLKLREYSFEFKSLNNDETGADLLNQLGFNSVFYYRYDNNLKYYQFYFNDIYHDSIIATYTYNVPNLLDSSKYDIAKMKFEKYIYGNYNSLTPTDLLITKELFKYYTTVHTMDLISIIPKNKRDENDNLIQSTETDFDTLFNQFSIIKLKDIEKL